MQFEGKEMRIIHLLESQESQLTLCSGERYVLPPFQLLEPIQLCMRCHIKAVKHQNKETETDGKAEDFYACQELRTQG